MAKAFWFRLVRLMNEKSYLGVYLLVTLTALRGVIAQAEWSGSAPTQKQVCFSVNECSDALIKRAAESKDGGMNSTDLDIEYSFEKLGREGVLALLRLMKSLDIRTRERADFALQSHHDFGEADLDQLIE